MTRRRGANEPADPLVELEDERDMLRFLLRLERDRVIGALLRELLSSLDTQIGRMVRTSLAPPASWPRWVQGSNMRQRAR